jgi:hydroxypyruvate reductase
MIAAAVGHPMPLLRTAFAVGTHPPADLAAQVEWREASHPLPDQRSVAAGKRALEIAGSVSRGESLVILLSGGASALLAAPAAGITLEDKRRTIELMMHAGADIHALNTVRKHLSMIKGGQLARACRGTTLTLAVSDVVGDDVSVIGSGPGVADETTWDAAAAALAQWGGVQHPSAVHKRVAAGRAGSLADTPKRDALENATGRVIANRQHALEGARAAAQGMGYRTVVIPEAVTGEARTAAARWLSAVREASSAHAGPICVISAGETTVRVTGTGKGGRNQEFALAVAIAIADRSREKDAERGMAHGGLADQRTYLDGIVASVGTDGIDGPTDAAGAWVDHTTLSRGLECGLADPRSYLEDNNSHAFFDRLGDLIFTGRTDTNVGDLQIYLRG